MLRFIIVVPITLVGLVLLAARYGGLGRLRGARRRRGPDGGRDRRRTRAAAPVAPTPRRSRAEIAAYVLLVAVALVAAAVGPRRPPVPPRREPGRVLLVGLPHAGRLRVQPAAARAAALLPDGGDVRAVRRLGLHGAAGAGADGDADGAAALPAARAARARRRVRRRRCCWPFGPTYLYFSRFAREDIYVASITLGAAGGRCSASSTARGATSPALIGVLLALSFATKETTFITVFVAGTFFLVVLLVRRERLLAPVRAVGLEAWGWGAAPRSSASSRSCSRPSSPTRAGSGTGSTTGLELLARPARRRPRRRVEDLLRRRAVRRGVAGAAARRGRRRRGAAPADAAARVPRLGVRALARVYSWAGEKFAWLVLHPLLPLLLLAGIGVQAIWDDAPALVRRARPRGRGGVRRLRRLRLVPGQRRAPRRPARAARLHAVLGGGRARRRPRGGAGRARRARRPPFTDHDRRRRGRDVPVGVVLPRPRRLLRRPRRAGTAPPDAAC